MTLGQKYEEFLSQTYRDLVTFSLLKSFYWGPCDFLMNSDHFRRKDVKMQTEFSLIPSTSIFLMMLTAITPNF